MESKENIAQYRLRLDKTLASPDLAHEETLKTLVKNQMLRSSQCEVEECTDNVIEKRTNEVSNVLQMLRSASLDDYHGSKPKETSHIGWKVKQDTEEYRVMYREGPQGTPFHTLLVEGYVDGPVDVCLCISWESILYKKWWPQTVIPTFKILASECLQRVRIGEQISLVRMKVSWPLSTREAVVHFFVFEYFQDDLIVVLLNSISDLESVDRSTHGFTKDGIPDVHDVVRIDVVGGFAIQKVNAGRSYFRFLSVSGVSGLIDAGGGGETKAQWGTLVNMDIKLDFVPPSFINFISRQLIGSGFRLYQKEVASVSKGDEDFGKVLRGPLYTRIREALYSDNYQNMSIDPENCDKESSVLPLEHAIKPVLVEGVNTDRKAFGGDCAPELLPEDNMGTDYKARFEIEEIQEIKIENNGHLEQGHKEIYRPTKSAESCCLKYRKKGDISAEVKHALETLENVISVIRECGLAPQTRSLQDLGNEELVDVGEGAVIKGTKSSEDAQFCSNSGVVCDESENKAVGRNRNEPRNSSSSIGSRQTGLNSYSEEANLNKIVPASPKENIPSASETKLTGFRSSNDETTKEPISDGGTSENKLVNAGDNNNRKILTNEGKNKRVRFCCLHFVAG